MKNHDRRLDRLASILPDQAKRLGCRREDHDLRERVDDIPEDTPDRDAIIERRARMARRVNAGENPIEVLEDESTS
jgi:hypothetical protein